MLSRLSVLLILLLPVAQTAYGGQGRLKGYDLFSWQRDGQWYYSLLPGTNRTKTYQEITSDGVARKGTRGIKEELKKLPKGATVLWVNGDSPSIAKASRGDAPALDLPDGTRVRRIKKICDKLGLKLELR